MTQANLNRAVAAATGETVEASPQTRTAGHWRRALLSGAFTDELRRMPIPQTMRQMGRLDDVSHQAI